MKENSKEMKNENSQGMVRMNPTSPPPFFCFVHLTTQGVEWRCRGRHGGGGGGTRVEEERESERESEREKEREWPKGVA